MQGDKQFFTIPELRAAVKNTKGDIFISVMFGSSESSVKLTKKEALFFLSRKNDDSTPEEYDMPCGYFGIMDRHGDVYLG